MVCDNGIVIMSFVLVDGIDQSGFVIFRVVDFFGNYLQRIVYGKWVVLLEFFS